MISSITLNQIRYVLALEKTGSFSEAAALCNITQSTLSIMIKKLENAMDLQLFDRKKKPIELTPEGHRLISQIRVLSNESENLMELIQETKAEFHGTLKIGIIPTLAPFLLPLFLDQLVQKYPNVIFSIHEITTNEIVSRLKLRDLDIGILSLPIQDKEIISTSLFHEEFLVYDTRDYPKAKKKFKIKDIDVNRLWLLEESHCLTNQVEKICSLRKSSQFKRNLIFNSGSILSLLELVHLNKGLTLLPKLATYQTNLINKKFVHTLEVPVPVREIGLVMQANFSKKRFLNILKDEILESVEPILNTSKKIRVMRPF